MKFSFNIGKAFGRPTPEQRAIVDRLRRGEITAEEAERLLGGHADAREFHVAFGADPISKAEPSAATTGQPVDESDEEAKARELVERVARDVYGDEKTVA